MEFKIDEKKLSTVLNYLASRPYVEVYQIVNMLSTLDRFDEKVIADVKSE